MRTRALLPTAIALAAAALLGGSSRADDQRLPLRLWSLRLPGTELGLEVADMNGDGLQDLVIAHMRATTGVARSVSIYEQGLRGDRFPAEPALVMDAPADACTFAAGDFDPHPGGEVVFLCPDRVELVQRSGARRVVVRVASFFDYPERGGLPLWDLAWDLDGDGAPELLVPTKTGYLILGRPGGGPLAQVGQVDVPLDLRFGPTFETTLLNRFLSASARLRRLSAADLNGDGRTDLVGYLEGGLASFHQRPDGGFPRRPDAQKPLDVVQGDAAKKGGEGEQKDGSEAFANVRLTLEDVDGDGRADLLVTRTLGELGVFQTMRTQQLVFCAKDDGTWDERRPAAVLNLKGITDDPTLVDWDGDGRKDLVLSSYRMDMFTNVRRAIAESLTITYMIFRQTDDAEARFRDEPDLVFDVEVPLEVLQTRGGHQAVILRADLDGDGIHDMISRRPDGGLQVELGVVSKGFFGGTTLGFDRERPIRLAVGRTEPPRVVDLDGDGKHKLVLEPFGGDDQEARTVRVVGVAR